MQIVPKNPLSLSIRLKTLRNEHQLTMVQLAQFLGFKGGKSSINNIESGRGYPSMEVLNRYIILFGASVDWIFGLSSKQYQEETLKYAEDESPKIKDICAKNHININEPKEYSDYRARKQYYNLNVRADIVYIRNLLAFSDVPSITPAVGIGILYLPALLNRTAKTPVYGTLAYKVEKLYPEIIATFDSLSIIAEPVFRSVKITEILGYPCNYEMTTEDIKFFCIDHYNGPSGTACFFIEKIFDNFKNTIKPFSTINEDQLENLWKTAYKIRDQYIPQ